MDILEHRCNEGLENIDVKEIMEDKSAFIFERDSFFRAFYVIRRLPFLAVLNDYHEFVGILTHSNIFDVIEDSFGMQTGGYIITIATQDCKGTIKELGTLLKSYHIGSLFTLDNGDQYIRRVIVNITDNLSEKALEVLIAKLEKKDFELVMLTVYEVTPLYFLYALENREGICCRSGKNRERPMRLSLFLCGNRWWR